MTEQPKGYPIHLPNQTDLEKIFRKAIKGDFRDIEDDLISCRCGNCGKFAINTDEDNKENEVLDN
jgi:hypothetical protein